MIPIRLIISISVIGVISYFAFHGLTMSYHTIHENEFTENLVTLQKIIDVMVYTGHPRDISNIYAQNGTTQIHTIHIPSEIVSVSFGAHGIVHSNTSSDGDIINASGIFYTSQKTGDHVMWGDSSCYFIKGIYKENCWIPSWDDRVFSLNKPGKYMVTFELITDGSIVYILVYDENHT